MTIENLEMKSDNRSDATESRKTYTRPRDESLEAFKDWINGIVSLFNPDAESTMTEEKWEARWREFWSNAKQEDEE